MRIFLKKSIDFLFDHALIVSGVSLVLLSVVDISDLNDKTINIFGIEKFQIGKAFYWLITAFSLFFGAIAVIHGKSIENLEKDINEKGAKINDLESKLNEVVIETNELFNSYLRLLVNNLDFKSTERISVYKVYQNKFKLLGRTSSNPRLCEVGRNEYPIDEGFISIGWEEEEFFIDNLPDPRSEFENYYSEISKIRAINKETLQSIRMQSRTFFISRINGFDGTAKAVIVFESLKNNAFQKDTIIEKIKGVKEPLIMFIEKNNGIIIKENTLGI